MLSIRYTKKSKEDIDSIFDFIASDNPLYADEVIERIRHSIAYLESFPYL
jgi:plasmid stabilization system protein ParE